MVKPDQGVIDASQGSFKPAAFGAVFIELAPPLLCDRLDELGAKFIECLAKSGIGTNLQFIE
jgi:hypothetical protein